MGPQPPAVCGKTAAAAALRTRDTLFEHQQHTFSMSQHRLALCTSHCPAPCPQLTSLLAGSLHIADRHAPDARRIQLLRDLLQAPRPDERLGARKEEAKKGRRTSENNPPPAPCRLPGPTCTCACKHRPSVRCQHKHSASSSSSTRPRAGHGTVHAGRCPRQLTIITA